MLVLVVGVAGCRQDMHDQPRVDPLEGSEFYHDGRGSRAPVPGTVARGSLSHDPYFHSGRRNGELVDEFPYAVTSDILKRGQERYGIFCTPCHDSVGTGRGMVVQRGYPEAASLHIDRLREAPAGYFFDVISRGFGRMPAYAAQIPPQDRWAIVAYVRALQLSQGATVGDVPTAEQSALAAEGDAP